MQPDRNRPSLLRNSILALLIGATPAWAAGAEMPFFDFAGYSYVSGPPATIGTVVAMAGKFNTIQPNPIWPLDLQRLEYTVMIQGLTVASVESYGPFQTITYSGGTIQLHSDAELNGIWDPAPPNTLVPATFLDGDLDLQGVFTEMSLFFNMTSGTGTISGLVDWQGGIRFGGMTNPCGWTVFGGVSSQDGLGIPAGYNLAWDPQLYGPEVPSPIAIRSWGAIKKTFRQ